MTYGFIGTGNMGGALAKALSQTVDKKDIYLSDKDTQKAQALAGSLGVQTATPQEVAQNCQRVFLGVKPQVMETMLKEIRENLQQNPGVLLITMAAGLPMDTIRRMAGGEYAVIRIMPNTPVSVGEGMILYTHTENVSKETVQSFCRDMQKAGMLDELPEQLIDSGCALSGCGPAFVFQMIEALAKGGEACGLSREQSVLYASQTVKGAAKLQLESKKEPEDLRIAVCSPGGATIEGVHSLENDHFEEIVCKAVGAAYRRTLELKK